MNFPPTCLVRFSSHYNVPLVCPSILYVVTRPPHLRKGGHIHRALLLGGHTSVVINIMLFLYDIESSVKGKFDIILVITTAEAFSTSSYTLYLS